MKTETVKISRIGAPSLDSPLKQSSWVRFVSEDNDIVSHLHRKTLLEEIDTGKLGFFDLPGPGSVME